MEGSRKGEGEGEAQRGKASQEPETSKKTSAGNLQISSLLTHSKLPQGTVKLEPDAQGSQHPPRGSGLEMEGAESGLWFPSQLELGPRSLPVALPSSLPLLLQAALKLIRDPNT